MKILISLIALLFSVSTWAAGQAAIGAVTVNPSAAAVLATTGAISSGSSAGKANYVVQVFASSTVAEIFDLQTLSGGTPVAHIYIMVPAMSSQTFQTNISFSIVDGLTLSVVAVNGVTGTVQANILYELSSTP